MSAVSMKDISITFPAVKANDHVNFEVDYGEVHSLVGENGAGKTTLMRILNGFYTPDEGEVRIDDVLMDNTVDGALDAGVAMVHQNFMQVPKLSVLENIILGETPIKGIGLVDYKTARKKARGIMDQMGLSNVDLNTRVQRLSVGERQKIEIVKLLYRGAKILIFDEPTAVLTPQEAQELFRIIEELKAEGKAIIYISHKLQEIIQISDKATVMRHGKVVNFFTKEQGFDSHMLASAMVGIPDFSMVTNTHTAVTEGDIVLDVNGLWYFDNMTRIAKICDMTFQVRKGEILGIGGVEGNGQQELTHLLVGLLKQNNGTLILDGQDISKYSTFQRREAGIGYISEDRMTHGVSLESNIQQNMLCGKERSAEYSRFGMLRKRQIDNDSLELIKEYDIRGGVLDAPVKSLSGGNMQKVILGREIERHPKLLIAVHPTRGLDVGAINFVREQLIRQREQGMAILLITADLEELIGMSDRILIMYEGQFSGEVKDVANVTEERLGFLMGGIREEKEEEVG